MTGSSSYTPAQRRFVFHHKHVCNLTYQQIVKLCNVQWPEGVKGQNKCFTISGVKYISQNLQHHDLIPPYSAAEYRPIYVSREHPQDNVNCLSAQSYAAYVSRCQNGGNSGLSSCSNTARVSCNSSGPEMQAKGIRLHQKFSENTPSPSHSAPFVSETQSDNHSEVASVSQQYSMISGTQFSAQYATQNSNLVPFSAMETPALQHISQQAMFPRSSAARTSPASFLGGVRASAPNIINNVALHSADSASYLRSPAYAEMAQVVSAWDKSAPARQIIPAQGNPIHLPMQHRSQPCQIHSDTLRVNLIDKPHLQGQEYFPPTNAENTRQLLNSQYGWCDTGIRQPETEREFQPMDIHTLSRSNMGTAQFNPASTAQQQTNIEKNCLTPSRHGPYLSQFVTAAGVLHPKVQSWFRSEARVDPSTSILSSQQKNLINTLIRNLETPGHNDRRRFEIFWQRRLEYSADVLNTVQNAQNITPRQHTVNRPSHSATRVYYATAEQAEYAQATQMQRKNRLATKLPSNYNMGQSIGMTVPLDCDQLGLLTSRTPASLDGSSAVIRKRKEADFYTEQREPKRQMQQVLDVPGPVTDGARYLFAVQSQGRMAAPVNSHVVKHEGAGSSNHSARRLAQKACQRSSSFPPMQVDFAALAYSGQTYSSGTGSVTDSSQWAAPFETHTQFVPFESAVATVKASNSQIPSLFYSKERFETSPAGNHSSSPSNHSSHPILSSESLIPRHDKQFTNRNLCNVWNGQDVTWDKSDASQPNTSSDAGLGASSNQDTDPSTSANGTLKSLDATLDIPVQSNTSPCVEPANSMQVITSAFASGGSKQNGTVTTTTSSTGTSAPTHVAKRNPIKKYQPVNYSGAFFPDQRQAPREKLKAGLRIESVVEIKIPTSQETIDERIGSKPASEGSALRLHSGTNYEGVVFHEPYCRSARCTGVDCYFWKVHRQETSDAVQTTSEKQHEYKFRQDAPTDAKKIPKEVAKEEANAANGKPEKDEWEILFGTEDDCTKEEAAEFYREFTAG